MGSKAFAAVLREFETETRRAFERVADELGLAGPEHFGTVLTGLAYHGGGVRYRVMLDDDDKTVITRIEMEGDKARLVADLDRLVDTAKLGKPSDVPAVASNLRTLTVALEGHAKFVRLVHPMVNGPDGIELMRAAGAREWRTH